MISHPMASLSWMSIPQKRKKAGRPITRKEEVLANWRGFDHRALEQDRVAPIKSASTLVPHLLNALGLERRRAETEILKVWNHLIDPQVVAHAQPTGLAKGTLFVTVDSHVWCDEIVRYRRHEILERLQHSFGATLISRISFRVG